jgi:predicted transcriptional regulator
MDVQFSPELATKLPELATQQGRKPSDVVEEAVARYLDEEDRLFAALERGERALERGDFLTQEQMADRIQRLLRP